MKRLMKLFGLVVIIGLLFSSLNGLSSTTAFAASLTPEADSYQVHGVTNQSQKNQDVDLDRGANRAESAANNIYKGLDTTKDVVGKTEQRKQVIEKARDHASDRLKEQAERAKSAPNPNSLDPNERNFLNNIQ
ncbi:MAG: hypothetical protein VKK42_06210 [Lyngbya sp.]|nr:hypothetical protein [Lyngbya sp.]